MIACKAFYYTNVQLQLNFYHTIKSSNIIYFPNENFPITVDYFDDMRIRNYFHNMMIRIYISSKKIKLLIIINLYNKSSINLIVIVGMFPQIRHNKKKNKIGTQQMQKQCQQAMKELQQENDRCIESVPPQLISDYNRVCKLKGIPKFYSQYFTYFVSQGAKQSMQGHFDEQIDNMMLGRSYYDKISTLIKQREAVKIEMQSQIQNPMIVLSDIDLGKIVTLIRSLRENLKQMIEGVISWEFWLRNFGGNDQESDHNNSLKIIFPANGINCIFVGLYDIQILRTSFLSEEINFSSKELDPFLTKMQLLNNSSKLINDAFYIPLSQGIQEYNKVQQYLINCIPFDMGIQAKDQQNRGISNSQQQEASTTSNSLRESAKRVMSINRQSNNNNSSNETNSKNSSSLIKVINSKVELPNSDKLQLQRIVREKEWLMKELRSQKIEREQLNRIVKQVESRTYYQHRLFQQKTQKYQNQIYALKTNIKQRPITNNIPNNYQNQLTSKVYSRNPHCRKSQPSLPVLTNQKSSQKKQHQNKTARNILLQKVNQNKLLEEKIAQLMMEKTNLQMLLEKEGLKADKQMDVYKKKLSTYQQTIDKLESQAKLSILPKQIQNNHSFNYLINKRLQRSQSVAKIYADNGKKIYASSKRKNDASNNKNSFEYIKASHKRGESQQISKERGLVITNRDDAIEILYSPKKYSKNHKQQQTHAIVQQCVFT